MKLTISAATSFRHARRAVRMWRQDRERRAAIAEAMRHGVPFAHLLAPRKEHK